MTSGASESLLARTGEVLARAIEADDAVRHLLAIRLRITAAVDDALRGGPEVPLDPDWLDRLRRSSAERFLEAASSRLSGSPVPAPWRLVLSGDLNDPRGVRDALVRSFVLERTYDLPLAILEVLPDAAFDDPAGLARRREDLACADAAMVAALAREDAEHHAAIRAARRGPFVRIPTPLALDDARTLAASSASAAWRNARVLNDARREGPAALRGRVDELRHRAEGRLATLANARIRWTRVAGEGLTVALDPG